MSIKKNIYESIEEFVGEELIKEDETIFCCKCKTNIKSAKFYIFQFHFFQKIKKNIINF